jgi:hypothetical protein
MFSNKTINYLNLHMGLWTFGNTILNLFGPIYLLKLGLTLPTIAIILGLANVVRFFLRPLSLLWTHKIGLKNSAILGTILSAGLYPLLFLANGNPIWIWILIFYMALAGVSYWLPFHAFYAIAGNLEKRGKQIAVREILMLVFSTAAPIVSGFLTFYFGFWALYVLGMLTTLLAAWPLLHTIENNTNERMTLRHAITKIDRRGFGLAIGDGIFAQAEVFIWTILVYYLAKNLIVLGWVLGLQIFLSSALTFLLGGLIDRGKGQKLFLVGVIGLSAVLMGRTFSVHTITDVVITQVLFALLSVFYIGPFSTVFYNMSKQTKNTLWFHFFAEAGYDLGSIIVLFSTAALILGGFRIQQLLPMGITGLLIAKFVLDSYYTPTKRRHPH